MTILCTLVNVYIFVIFGRIILSWFPRSTGILGTVGDIFYGLTEPVLGPVRRMMPIHSLRSEFQPADVICPPGSFKTSKTSLGYLPA